MKLRLSAALGLSAALLLTACAANEAPLDSETTGASGESATAEPGGQDLSGTLSGVGASAQDVAQQTWIAGFQTANPGVTVNYSPEGSGTGRETFIAGGSGYAGSDRAYTLEEIESNTFGSCEADAKPYNLPVYISPIAVIMNVEGIESLNMTAQTIAGIFKGEITNWNDPAIAADNEGVELPDLAITAVHRADTSGTTENFTDYLVESAPDVWDAESSGDWPYEGGEAANQTQGIVSAVSGGVGTIGYVDASQAGDFAVVHIGQDGQFAPPTTEAAAAIVENSGVEEGRADGDMAIALNREAEGYPVVLVSYLIVCSDYADDSVAELVKAYATYVASEDGQNAAAERAGSAPISAGIREAVVASIESVQ